MAKQEAAEQSETPAAGKRKLSIAIAIAVGVLVGGGGGALLVGPLLANRLAPKAAAAEKAGGEGEHAAAGEEAEGKEQQGEGSEEKESAAPAVTHAIDNLVLNPAGSNGTRFLMVTVAFALRDEEVKTEMTARDAEVRDAVLGTLGKLTVEQLTDVARRDTIKTAMRDSVASLFKKGAVKRAYLPQFVIQ